MDFPNDSLQIYSCVGNKAVIVSGKAEGASGVVTGKHGGSEHIMIDFVPDVLAQMTYDDKIIVHTRGQGLALTDYPDIKLFNLDPDLLVSMKIEEKDCRTYKKGAISIGIVVHSDCLKAGHGPGVATLFTCSESQIEPVIDPTANIADILSIGRMR